MWTFDTTLQAHPLPAGLNFKTFEDGSQFRPFEISRFDEYPDENEIFVEHKYLFGLKVRFEIDCLVETGRRLIGVYLRRADLPGSVISRIENRQRSYKRPIPRLQINERFSRYSPHRRA